MSYFFKRSLIHSLSVSILAASLVGEHASIPFLFNSFTRPMSKGASGPTITKSIFLSFA